MKNKLICLLWLLALIPFSVFAQNEKPKLTEPKLTKEQQKRKNVISGEIKLESAAKAKDPYEVSYDAALAYLTSLQASVKSGNPSKIKEISDEGLSFATTTYLHCSVNFGVCAYMLDTLLEADIINGRIDKKDTCPNLRGFWKKYLSNDLESRHKYATKIGFLAETGEFNARTRPKYIKCQDTVKKERAGDMSDAEFFKARYAESSKLDAINKTIDYIQTLKAKNINVFQEVSNFR